MKSKLIAFRGILSKQSNFGVGEPIRFPDGHKGTIYSILKIEIQPEGHAYVYGKYRPE